MVCKRYPTGWQKEMDDLVSLSKTFAYSNGLKMGIDILVIDRDGRESVDRPQ